MSSFAIIPTEIITDIILFVLLNAMTSRPPTLDSMIPNLKLVCRLWKEITTELLDKLIPLLISRFVQNPCDTYEFAHAISSTNKEFMQKALSNAMVHNVIIEKKCLNGLVHCMEKTDDKKKFIFFDTLIRYGSSENFFLYCATLIRWKEPHFLEELLRKHYASMHHEHKTNIWAALCILEEDHSVEDHYIERLCQILYEICGKDRSFSFATKMFPTRCIERWHEKLIGMQSE